MEKQGKTLKSLTAARRCAKAALFLYALKSTNFENEKMRRKEIQDLKIQLQKDRFNNNIKLCSENEEMWRKEIQELKIQLLKERFINKKIKLCSFIELLVQLLCFLALSTFFLFFLLQPR